MSGGRMTVAEFGRLVLAVVDERERREKKARLEGR